MFRRSITSRLTTLVTRRFNASFGQVIHHDDEDKNHSIPVSTTGAHTNHFSRRGYHNTSGNAVAGLGALLRDRRGFITSHPFLGIGSSYCSYSSSAIREGSEKIEYISDVAGILGDSAVEVAATQAPVVNEVAAAAADSFFPVAALQYFIDGVHNVTGLNWWASIALTTLFIRSATVPILINTMKSTTKLSMMRPQMEEIREQMMNSMDPKAAVEGQLKMKALFKQYGVTPFTPLKGLFIQGPIFISFYMAISNMVEKMPSFKGGGAFWFTDLTTPDSLYIFPVLTALSFLLTVELNMQEGMEGNPMANTMKNFSRILAVLTVPFTMNFPKAIFCYWCTSNLFSLAYGYVIKRPPVKKFLGIPEITQQPSASSGSNFSLFGGSKSLFGGLKSVPGESSSALPSTSPPSTQQSKPVERKISSSSVISQRLRNLEKSVKGRKKNKKR